jgi:hypothetical protein
MERKAREDNIAIYEKRAEKGKPLFDKEDEECSKSK